MTTPHTIQATHHYCGQHKITKQSLGKTYDEDAPSTARKEIPVTLVYFRASWVSKAEHRGTILVDEVRRGGTFIGLGVQASMIPFQTSRSCPTSMSRSQARSGDTKGDLVCIDARSQARAVVMIGRVGQGKCEVRYGRKPLLSSRLII